MKTLTLLLVAVLFAISGSVQAQNDQEKKPAAPSTPKQEKKADEFRVLFDGTSLDNFRGYKDPAIGKGWSVSEGTLMFDGSGGGDIITKEEFQDFELHFDWKVAPGANSGVMYRVSLGDGAPYLSGPEFQILDDAKHADGKREITSAGSLYAMYKPQNKKLNPVGTWNSSKIVLAGKTVQHWVNGAKVVEAEIGSKDWNDHKNASKFKTWEKFGANSKGHICFQDHGDKVWYRNIKVKVLNPAKK